MAGKREEQLKEITERLDQGVKGFIYIGKIHGIPENDVAVPYKKSIGRLKVGRRELRSLPLCRSGKKKKWRNLTGKQMSRCCARTDSRRQRKWSISSHGSVWQRYLTFRRLTAIHFRSWIHRN